MKLRLVPECPFCSHYREDNGVLHSDVLDTPSIVGSQDKQFRLVGCCHTRPFFGPHPTEDQAFAAWEAEVARLKAQKARRRAELDRLFASRQINQPTTNPRQERHAMID